MLDQRGMHRTRRDSQGFEGFEVAHMDDSDPAQLAPSGWRVFNMLVRYSSVIVALGYNAGSAWFVYARYATVSPGSQIRDMGYPAFSLIIGALSICTAIWMGIFLACYKHWREALLGLVLSFLPFLTMHFMLSYMMHSIGFTNDRP